MPYSKFSFETLLFLLCGDGVAIIFPEKAPVVMMPPFSFQYHLLTKMHDLPVNFIQKMVSTLVTKTKRKFPSAGAPQPPT